MNNDPQQNNGDLAGTPDMARIRGRLASLEGRHFWKSLEEAAESPEFERMLHREFPEQASEWDDPVGRRRFLHLMGASLGLAGLSGCTVQPKETIVPQAHMPEYQIPGKPKYFATAITLGGYATGVLAESHMGRPTKLEGNAEHPASRGALDAITQAEILTLYDPDRAQVVTHVGEIRPWNAALGAIERVRATQTAGGGRGLRVLTGAVGSPTLTAQIQALLDEFPEARWHRWEPAAPLQARRGAILAFGEPVETIYHFARAQVVVSLDADFLMRGPASIRQARDFAEARRLIGGAPHPARH
jgi:molybdopterin-containing oxidoreductase family iron-sulfur binding subunit